MSAQVLTQHNNNQRTGVNRAETKLTVQAVRTQFRKMFEVAVDPPEVGGPGQWASQIVAQPLFVSDLQWSDGTIKDVLIICTMHGTVYAFDATNNCTLLWAKWLGQSVLDLRDANGNINDCKDLFGTNPEWGILSTPVIDPDLKRVYVVMWHNDNGVVTYKLHKLDLVTNLITGNEIGQVIINGVAPNAPQQVFNPVFQKQRPGLLLIKRTDLPQDRQANVGTEGTIYIAFGASIEQGIPYHGWVFAYDADTLNQRAVWCSTPNANGNGAGVWQAGAGLAADEEGNIYLMTGNGDFDAAKLNFGESFVKLRCKDLKVANALLDSFTPWNWQDLNVGDKDLGSSGPVCIPGTDYIVGAGKTGKLYSLNRQQMGGVGNAGTQTNNDIDEVQATASLTNDHVHGSPVYFQPLSWLYLWGENDVLKAFKIDRITGQFSKAPEAAGQGPAPEGMPGGMLSLSANGNADAIIWALLPLQVDGVNEDANKNLCVDGVLRAFDATNLQEIWKSSTNATDQLGHFAKFAPPTIAKGRVYVPTYDGKFVVYGIEPSQLGRVVNRTCIKVPVVMPKCGE